MYRAVFSYWEEEKSHFGLPAVEANVDTVATCGV
jgi:hypothetical protein